MTALSESWAVMGDTRKRPRSEIISETEGVEDGWNGRQEKVAKVSAQVNYIEVRRPRDVAVSLIEQHRGCSTRSLDS